MSPEKTALRPQWELLRLVAIALMVAYHANAIHGDSGPADHLIDLVFTASWIGSDLLLCLAGYLATLSLLRRDRGLKTYAAYLGNRFVRIVPPYFVFLAVYLHTGGWFQNLVGAGWTLNPGFEPGLWTFTANNVLATGLYSGVALEGMFALSLGVQLLLVAGLLLSLVRGKKVLLGILAAAEVVAIGLRFVVPTPDALTLYFFTPTRMDSFLTGMALALVLSHPPLRETLLRFRWPLLAAGVAVLGAAVAVTKGLSPWGGPLVHQVAYPAVSFFVATVFVWLEGTKMVPKPLATLARAGKFTFATYLWKLPMVYLCHHLLAPVLPGNTLVTLGLAIVVIEVACFAAGALWYWVVERPLTLGLNALSKRLS